MWIKLFWFYPPCHCALLCNLKRDPSDPLWSNSERSNMRLLACMSQRYPHPTYSTKDLEQESPQYWWPVPPECPVEPGILVLRFWPSDLTSYQPTHSQHKMLTLCRAALDSLMLRIKEKIHNRFFCCHLQTTGIAAKKVSFGKTTNPWKHHRLESGVLGNAYYPEQKLSAVYIQERSARTRKVRKRQI